MSCIATQWPVYICSSGLLAVLVLIIFPVGIALHQSYIYLAHTRSKVRFIH